MSAQFFGKFKAILADLTTVKGNLDADISTRAPASTALDDTVWTDAKAGFLDAAISGIGGGGTKRAVRLDSGSSWTIPSDMNADKYVHVTIVGGGGGGGGSSSTIKGGSGGGGGETIYRLPMLLVGSSVSYSVGAGGAGGAAGNNDGVNGDDTTFNSVTAAGGLRGYANGGVGGDGGGHSRNYNDPGEGGDISAGHGKGLDGYTGSPVYFGGGGGGQGSESTSSNPAAGGNSFAIGGDASTDPEEGGGGGGSYGKGGNGGQGANPAVAGVDGGGGGGARDSLSEAGADGGDGFILIEYESE